jgi:ligand-binding sensor domain-containing protein
MFLFACSKSPYSSASDAAPGLNNPQATGATQRISDELIQADENRPPPDLKAIQFAYMSIDDGLSSNTVYSVWQDHYGFLWIGTMDGLNRYDGYEIKVYRHDPIDPDTLSSSAIYAIYEDSQNTLWVGTSDIGFLRIAAENCGSLPGAAV